MTRSEMLPAGRACALALSFDVDAETALLSESAALARDAGAMTHQAFGPRVGVPRLLRMLGEEDVRATFFVPGYTARRWPGLVESILAGGHEVGHHSDLHRSPLSLTADQERADFERALQTLTALGATVRGFRAALWQTTEVALGAAAEAGLAYDSSMLHDDRPFVLRIGTRRLAELPVHWALDDWEQYGWLPTPDIGIGVQPPSRLTGLWQEELDAQRREGGLCVTTAHPFLSGRAARVEALRELIGRARDAGDVWIAPLHEVAERTLAATGIAERPIATTTTGMTTEGQA